MVLKSLTVFSLLVTGASVVIAVDINPMRKVQPDKFRNPPGKRYSIFAGDPERVQKANEVKVKDLTAAVELSPPSFSLSGENEEVVATFTVRNRSDNDYTLSFPDAQRYDLALVTLDDKLIYLWSSDKMFVQQTGMSFMNGGEILQFRESLSKELLTGKLQPGTYKIAMILSNYPEVKAAAEFEVRP